MESIDEYLAALASERPTPGGGSAATLVAALGAALAAMVARINAANPKYAAVKAELLETIAEADGLRDRLVAARAQDEAAFARVVEASAQPKDSGAERATALERALHDAAEAPLLVATLALDVLRLAERLLEIPNRNLASDIGCAAEFASAAIAASAYNVRINHRFMHDASATAPQAARLESCERESAALVTTVRREVATLLG